MRRLLLMAGMLLLVGCSTNEEPKSRLVTHSEGPLPAPYHSIEVLPEHLHGWFINEKPLAKIIRKMKVKSVLEVGSWMGQSTIAIAEMLPDDGQVVAVDHWLGSIENQEGHPSYHPLLPKLYEQFLSNVIHHGLAHKIVPIRMASLEAAKVVTVKPDLIYIDGAHDTESVYNDLNAWYPFVEERGILCGDDWQCPDVQVAVERFAKERKLRVEGRKSFWVVRKRGESRLHG